MSSHFCPLPFKNIAFTIKGDARLCCDSYVVRDSKTGKPLNIRNMTASQIWNSPEFEYVRTQLLDNKRPKECQKCWAQEEKGILSKRYYSFSQLNAEEKSNLIQEAQSGDSILETIEIRFGNSCNQMCRTCDPFSSSTWVRFIEKNNDNPFLKEIYGTGNQVYSYTANKFTDQLADVLGQAQKIRILGGEPAVQPAVNFFLEKLVSEYNASEKEIEIVTNGTIHVLALLPLLAKFKKVIFILSIDGIGPVNEYIRMGSVWDENLTVLDAALKELDGHVIRIHTVVSAYNFLRLEETVNWFRQTQYKKAEHSLIFVSDPDFLSVDTLPLSIQEQGRTVIHKILATVPAESALHIQLATYLKSPMIENTFYQKKFYEHLELLDASSPQTCVNVLPELQAWLQTIRLSPEDTQLHPQA